MGSVLAHRGPDGEGLSIQGSCGLVYRRLAILDLSENANQPMQRDNLLMVYNGEIHNYLEIRDQLEKCGYYFQTGTDTEVVLTAYHRWGLECFGKFNGMWAVAFWDCQSQSLLLCRDRFGIKPLYYSYKSGILAFASEIKALLTVFPELSTPRPSEIWSYLLGGNTDSGEETFYQGIHAIPPATYLEIDQSGPQSPLQYWDYHPGPIVHSDNSIDEFKESLTDAVRIRMRSDVPVGACLSGGLDSSSVTQLASGFSESSMHCFSLRYPDFPRIDESRFAQMVMTGSDRFLTHWITPEPDHLVKKVERIVAAHDAPTSIRGRLGMWSIYEEAGQHVKAALVGEGADELLGGYTRFLWPYLADRVWKHKREFLTSLDKMNLGWQLYRGLDLSLFDTFIELFRPWVKKLSLTRFTFTEFVGRDLFDHSNNLDASRFFYTWKRGELPHPFADTLNNALWQEFRFIGLPELLRCGDAIGMAHSVEVRAPFLDHRLVEFCFRLPISSKIGNGWTKNILRQSMADHLPAEVAFRRNKKGLPTPHRAFFTQESNQKQIKERLLEGNAIAWAYLDRKGTEKLLRRYDNREGFGSELLCSAIWRCLSLEVWLAYLESFSKKPRSL